MTDLTADLTADERVDYDRILTDLHTRGYRTVDRHNEIAAGGRVRHRGHQYPEAYRHGSGTVLAVTVKDPSSWSVSYNMPDVEIVVLWDEGAALSRLSTVAQYHVETVEAAPC